MKLRFTPRAVDDIGSISDYIRRHNAQAAARVGLAIQHSLDLLATSPKLGIDRPGLGVRKLGVARLPYSIYYRVGDDAIEIVHVRDDRRRPLVPGDI